MASSSSSSSSLERDKVTMDPLSVLLGASTPPSPRPSSKDQKRNATISSTGAKASAFTSSPTIVDALFLNDLGARSLQQSSSTAIPLAATGTGTGREGTGTRRCRIFSDDDSNGGGDDSSNEEEDDHDDAAADGEGATSNIDKDRPLGSMTFSSPSSSFSSSAVGGGEASTGPSWLRTDGGGGQGLSKVSSSEGLRSTDTTKQASSTLTSLTPPHHPPSSSSSSSSASTASTPTAAQPSSSSIPHSQQGPPPQSSSRRASPPPPPPPAPLSPDGTQHLSGEQRLAHLPNLYLQTVHGLVIPGHLLITSYKIIFTPASSQALPPQLSHLPSNYFRVSMACIGRTDKDMSRKQAARDPNTSLIISIKDGRVLRIVVPELPTYPSTPGGSSSSSSNSYNLINQRDLLGPEISIDKIKNLIDAYAFPENINRHLFCFAHFKSLIALGSPLAVPAQGLDVYDLKSLIALGSPLAVPAQGLDVYNLKAEFTRQFTRPDETSWLDEAHKASSSSPACPWRYSRLNEKYGLCPSYPPVLVVPRDANEEELIACAAFRSENRLPVLTWGSNRSSASIWRSSQPKVGVAGNSSPEDEKVLRLIGAGEMGLVARAGTLDEHGHSSNSSGGGMSSNGYPSSQVDPSSSASSTTRMITGLGILRIMDLRHKTAAMANRATGHGYESQNNYPNSTLTFLNIGNIHVMRDSQTRLNSILQSTTIQDTDWSSLIESTKWLTHIRLCLNAAYRTAYAVLREKASVLLHCSHGWDRTSQIASLAQLMLDPYYRSFQGFPVLIEKDWLSFGHPFHLRTAHGLDRAIRNDEQLAPIFLQFLDCVYQLCRQFPHLFEFNGRYLLTLADHVLDCRFGTFLCNTPRERVVLREEHKAMTPSLWAYLNLNRPALRNPLYTGSTNGRGGKKGGLYSASYRILDTPLPSILRRVTLWNDYFLRWSAKPTHPPEVYVAMRKKEREVGKDPDVELAWSWVEEEEVLKVYGEVGRTGAVGGKARGRWKEEMDGGGGGQEVINSRQGGDGEEEEEEVEIDLGRSSSSASVAVASSSHQYQHHRSSLSSSSVEGGEGGGGERGGGGRGGGGGGGGEALEQAQKEIERLKGVIKELQRIREEEDGGDGDEEEGEEEEEERKRSCSMEERVASAALLLDPL